MQKLLLKLHGAALRRPRTCIGLWLALLLTAAAALPLIELDASFRVFFKADDPLVRSLDEMQASYTSGDYSAFMIAVDEGDIFNRRTLSAIEELTAAAWKLPRSVRVDSLSNLPYSRHIRNDLQVTELIDSSAAELDDVQLYEVRNYVLNNRLLTQRLVAPDASATLVVVTFAPETGESLAASIVIHKKAMAIRDQLKAKYPDHHFHITGVVAGNAAVTWAATRDGFVIIPIAFGFAFLCMFWFLRRESGQPRVAMQGLLAAVAVISVATLIPMGLMAALGISANNVTTVIPIVILTLAVADSLHILITYNQRLYAGDAALAAMQESLRLNAEPVWLTSITTIMGFMALNLSESPPFVHMGNLVAFGVLLAWLASNSLLPAIMLLFQTDATHRFENRHLSSQAMARWVIRNHVQILVAGLAIFTAGFACLGQNRLNESWITYLAESTDFGNDTARIVDRFENLNEIEFDLDAGKPDGIYEPEYLLKVRSFADWLRSQPETRFVQSLDRTLMHLNQVIHDNDPLWYRLPTSRKEAAQYLLLYEMSLPYGASMSNDIKIDRSASRLVVGLRSSDVAYHLNFQQRAQGWLQHNAPELWHPGTGTTGIMSSLARRDAQGMIWATLLALGLIAATLALSFRSLRHGLLSVLVNAMPATIALGIWGLLVGQIGLSVSIVFPISIGIIVDYCVHFLSKYRRAKRENGLNTEQAIEYVFGTVGVALLVTTAVLVVNFGILSLSLFRVNIYMGIITSMTIALALLTQLFFLPALLLTLDRLRNTRLPANAQT